MRLVTRLTLAFLTVVVAAIALATWARYDDEVRQFETDMDRTHRLVAATLADAVEVALARDGLDAAERLVEGPGTHQQTDLRVRWVCVGRDDPPPLVPCDTLDRLGDFVTLEPVAGRRATVVPVRLEGGTRGAIEVSESRDFEGAWVREVLVRVASLALLTVLGMVAFAFVLGFWLVARPTRALVAKARAVGRGELAPDLALRTGDEFEQLAAEMNAMCVRLLEAKQATEQATTAREAALEHLRHADRLATVGRVASGLAHELGTPLNVIEARAGLIVDDPLAEARVKDSAHVIIGQAEQVARLVKQLLVFARPRRLAPEPVALDALGRTIAELLRPLAARKPVTLDVAGLAAAPTSGDPVLLQQAVTNLVVNALHACNPGGRVRLGSGRLSIPPATAAGPGPWVFIAVADDGPGIEPALQRSIFEPFFTTRPPGEGTGLGLPIAARIVEEHGGVITLDSAPGRGATFTVCLPGGTP
ncbi:MAG: HAMP domain-containing histidine kinase [Myxococcaceae bacterium]|jgi:signal transduction histidine kinase|nr:HAMP domain-containing histidine kinase [Myxococcaceae bacterium]